MMGALTRLAALAKTATEPALLDAYADSLEDLRPRALELAFVWLERNWNVPGTLPVPAEIRELATRLRQEEQEAERERQRRAEQQALERRRAEHPEEFFSYTDFLAEASRRLAAARRSPEQTQMVIIEAARQFGTAFRSAEEQRKVLEQQKIALLSKQGG